MVYWEAALICIALMIQNLTLWAPKCGDTYQRPRRCPKFAYRFRTRRLRGVRNRTTYFGHERHCNRFENRDPEAHRKGCDKRGLDAARLPRSWRARRRGQDTAAVDTRWKFAAGGSGALRQAVIQQSDTEKQSSRPKTGYRGHRSAGPDPRTCGWHDCRQ